MLTMWTLPMHSGKFNSAQLEIIFDSKWMCHWQHKHLLQSALQWDPNDVAHSSQSALTKLNGSFSQYTLLTNYGTKWCTQKRSAVWRKNYWPNPQTTIATCKFHTSTNLYSHRPFRPQMFIMIFQLLYVYVCMPKVSVTTGIWTYDLPITSPTPYH